MSLRKLRGLATQNKGVKMPNLHHPGEKSGLPAKDNSPLPISASEADLSKSAAEWKWWKCLKVTHRFPRPPWLCWEWGGRVGGWGAGGSLNDRRISEGAEGAAAQRQPEANTFNGSPPNWKGLFSSLSDERVRARKGKRNDRFESRWWGGG